MECLGEERCAVVRTRAMQKQDEATQKKDKARATYLKWENSIRTLGQEDPGRNLLDHQYTFSLNLTLSREVYDRWSAKFFLLSKMLRTASILASLELFCLHMIASQEEVRKEAWGIILRSGQAHFPEGVKEMAETEIQGIQTTNLCLASHTTRSQYGTKYIPILGEKAH